MGRLEAISSDWNGNRITNSSVMYAKSAKVTLSSVDEFPDGEVVFGGNERANLQALVSFQTLRFRDTDANSKLAWAVIHDPTLQIDDTGDTITLTIPNITDQLTHFSVGTNAAYQTTLNSIIAQIGAQGETEEWITLWDAAGKVVGYSAIGADFTRNYNAAGQFVNTQPGTGKFSGWSATALDDGPNTATVQPVTWTPLLTNVSINGNNITKLTATDGYFDGNAYGAEQVTAVTDQHNNPAHGDAALQWQVTDLSSEYVIGFAIPGQTAINNIMFGIHIVPSATPTATNATGLWSAYENGVVPTSGGFPVIASYVPGDIFRIVVDYTSGTPHIVYWHNAQPIFQSTVLPPLPLMPVVSIASPGGSVQNATLFTTVKPSQQFYSTVFPQNTPLEALIQTAVANGIHVRQRRDATGAPIRALEVGNFGEQAGVRLIGGGKVNLDRALEDPTLRVVTKMNWKQESSQVINTIAPHGANGANGTVDLERAFNIVYDPNYINFWAKYGAMAAIFPEYDGVNYPIKRTLVHGTGQWEYYVRDVASYNAIGMEIRGKYDDPQFSYPSGDTTDATQELVARALYLATVAKLKLASQINDVLEVETVAGKFLPPLGGQRVKVDFRRISGDVKGNFTTMNTRARAALTNPYVIGVDRQWNENGAKTDIWRLSAYLRPSATSSGSQGLQSLTAIKLITQNSVTYLPVIGEADVDANPVNEHALIVEMPIPNDVFRITSAPLRVTFSALRQQVTTAQNPLTQFVITIPMSTVTITSIHDNPQGTSHSIPTLSGGAYDSAKGFATTTEAITNISQHVHKLGFANGGNETPTNLTRYLQLQSGSDPAIVAVNNNAGAVHMHTETTIINVDNDPTKHPHSGMFNRNLSVAATLTGVIDQQSVQATLPPHTHPIDTELNDVAIPTGVDLYLDSGTGQFVYLSNQVPDTLSGGVGPWSQSFEIASLHPYLANSRGKLVRIKLVSLDAASGTKGVGHLKALGLWRAEIGGLGSQVQIAQ